MGQQQLLLLVLSTVIVGLATVAGIQAFEEGQQQATQDAITQRALSIGNDIYGATQTPAQLGGVTFSNSNVDAFATTAGFDSGSDIPAEGAGSDAECDLGTGSSSVTVYCASDGSNDDLTSSGNSSSNEYVEVEVTSSGATVTNINGNTNVGS
jgi:hypothetical protein